MDRRRRQDKRQDGRRPGRRPRTRFLAVDHRQRTFPPLRPRDCARCHHNAGSARPRWLDRGGLGSEARRGLSYLVVSGRRDDGVAARLWRGGLGTGAVFTLGGFLDAQCPPGPSQTACGREAYEGGGGSYLLRFARGPDGRAAATRVAKEYVASISYPVTPANLVNFGEAVNFPLIFGLVLIVFGITTLVHVLVVSVARRRREAGLLRALGFVRRQIAYSVWWQTTTIALVGIVVGVPVGIVLGRAIWQEFARSLGVLPDAVVVPWVIVAVAAGPSSSPAHLPSVRQSLPPDPDPRPS